MRLKKTEQSPKLREFMTSGRPSTDSFTQQIFKIIFLRCVYTTQQVAQLVERKLLRNKLTSFCSVQLIDVNFTGCGDEPDVVV